MFLVNQHNRDIHLDCTDNIGILKAQYEPVNELVSVDVDIRSAMIDVSDLFVHPTFENFMLPDNFHDICRYLKCVAFPLKNQHLQEVTIHDKTKWFIANPLLSPVSDSDITAIQKFAVHVGKDKNNHILFLCRSLFNVLTIQSLFGWSHNEHKSALTEIKPRHQQSYTFQNCSQSYQPVRHWRGSCYCTCIFCSDRRTDDGRV